MFTLVQVDISTIYGAAAIVMILLTWVYVTAHLMLFGAKFTYLYANRFGDDIKREQD